MANAQQISSDDIIRNIIDGRVKLYAQQFLDEAKKKLDEKLPEIIAEVCIEINEREDIYKLGRNITFNINK